MVWQVTWAVFVDGKDVSNFMRPTLQTIDVSDKDGETSDTCRMTFDDSGGQLALPDVGVQVEVYLENALVFRGFVDKVQSQGSRGGGRILSIDAKGIDTRSKLKERQAWHLDDATLGDALKKGAKQAGIDIMVDPELAAIERDYWSPDRMHFLEWASRLAAEHGATFKVQGGVAGFVKRGAGSTVDGRQMPTVTASFPGNIISWDINPSRGRTQFSKTRVRYFDRESASFVEKEVEVEGFGADLDVVDDRPETAADGDMAERVATGRKIKSERESGVGSVTLDLTVEAQAEGTFILAGARPGIDGTYRIVGVTHKASRSGGATTSLEIKQPQGEAGKDERIPTPTPRPDNVPIPTTRPAA